MLKFLLSAATALLACNALVSTAEARGCGGGYSQSYARQSYARPKPNYFARRQAIAAARAEAKAEAAAKAQAAAKVRAVALRRAAEATIKLAKAETPEPKTDASAPEVKPESKKVEAVTAEPAEVAAAAETKLCRKFSAATGGLVETACE
jgi:hypothetical protein